MPTTTPSRRFIIVDDSTVREARDRQEEKRPKKRARRDDSDDEDSTYLFSSPDSHPKGPYERDPVYYKDDDSADCIVRVRGHIFKIQSEMLSCCPEMSASLQAHIDRCGPPTEDKPFYCALPTVDEYRAFLWALHATYDQLAEIPSDYDELERLAFIVKMSNKYHIPRMSEWASETLHKTANDTVFMESCSSASLALLVEMAVDKKYEKSLPTITKRWYERVLNKSTPSVPAMQIADKYELHDLLGISYYVHVQDMLDRQTSFTEKGATQLRADPKLNNGQVMRLLTGFWSLVNMWERLRLKPIALPKGKGCSAETHCKCTASWDRRWVSAVGWKRIMGVNSADTLTLLDCLRDQLSNDDDLKAALDPECRLAGLEALKTFRTKTLGGLADHFFACV